MPDVARARGGREPHERGWSLAWRLEGPQKGSTEEKETRLSGSHCALRPGPYALLLTPGLCACAPLLAPASLYTRVTHASSLLDTRGVSALHARLLTSSMADKCKAEIA